MDGDKPRYLGQCTAVAENSGTWGAEGHMHVSRNPPFGTGCRATALQLCWTESTEITTMPSYCRNNRQGPKRHALRVLQRLPGTLLHADADAGCMQPLPGVNILRSKNELRLSRVNVLEHFVGIVGSAFMEQSVNFQRRAVAGRNWPPHKTSTTYTVCFYDTHSNKRSL